MSSAVTKSKTNNFWSKRIAKLSLWVTMFFWGGSRGKMGRSSCKKHIR